MISKKTIEVVQAFPGFFTILGNHDEVIYKPGIDKDLHIARVFFSQFEKVYRFLSYKKLSCIRLSGNGMFAIGRKLLGEYGEGVVFRKTCWQSIQSSEDIEDAAVEPVMRDLGERCVRDEKE